MMGGNGIPVSGHLGVLVDGVPVVLHWSQHLETAPLTDEHPMGLRAWWEVDRVEPANLAACYLVIQGLLNQLKAWGYDPLLHPTPPSTSPEVAPRQRKRRTP